MKGCLALVQQQVYAHMVLLEAAWFYLIQYMRQEGSTGYRMLPLETRYFHKIQNASTTSGCFYWIQDDSTGYKMIPLVTGCFY